MGGDSNAPCYGGFFDDDDSCDEDNESVVEECSALLDTSKQIVSAEHIEIEIPGAAVDEDDEEQCAKSSFDMEPQINSVYSSSN